MLPIVKYVVPSTGLDLGQYLIGTDFLDHSYFMFDYMVEDGVQKPSMSIRQEDPGYVIGEDIYTPPTATSFNYIKHDLSVNVGEHDAYEKRVDEQ